LGAQLCARNFGYAALGPPLCTRTKIVYPQIL